MSAKHRELVIDGDQVVGITNAPGPKLKHTAGPWRIEGPRFNAANPLEMTGYDVYGPGLTWVASILGEHCRVPRDESEANARLIAAAPELLAALREAVEGCPCSLKERDSGHRTECRAPAWAEVIAKAEGRSE